MKYKVGLNSKAIYALADELNTYVDEFTAKVQTFLSQLTDLGISVARANGGIYGGYIVYSKEFENSTGGNITVHMIATGETLAAEWYVSSKSKEVRTEVINTLLMAEYGSGRYAIKGVDGLGGRGTLNVYGHAFDSNGWYWWSDTMSRDGELEKVRDGRFKFHSDGLPPARPLHNAVKACIDQVEGIAREVFV